MSTERSSFGLNSILPSGYITRAEAFAKCLQDKLRSLGGGEDSVPGDNESVVERIVDEGSKVRHGSLSNFSEEEIADNVFIQGPLSYKRRSAPDHGNKIYTNGNSRGKYHVSLVDKRGMSSDSEDSEAEDIAATSVHPRVAHLQSAERPSTRRLASVNSIDSTSSWCSCEESPDPDDDDEVGSALASQIKGSPPIHNPRMRNYKRKSREEKLKIERPPLPTQDADLFFDFDVECFSPVNLEEDGEYANGFESTQQRLMEEDRIPWETDFPKSVSTDLILEDLADTDVKIEKKVVTPPPSPVNIKKLLHLDIDRDSDCCGNKTTGENEEQVIVDDTSCRNDESVRLTENDSSSSDEVTVKQFSDIEYRSEAQSEDTLQASDEFHHQEIKYTGTIPHQYDIGIEVKDSGICSCEETSSRTGDDETPDIIENCELEKDELIKLDVIDTVDTTVDTTVTTETTDITDTITDGVAIEATESLHIGDEEGVEKTKVVPTVMVMCDGVEIEESYLPSPRMKLRRCSSLKTWKTPPGTPGRKKIVRFADALGLDLADVRTFLDEIPKIPNSAFEDLHYELPAVSVPPPSTQRTLIPMFQQPGTQFDFLQRVRQNNVNLESAVLTDVTLLSISGIVRVRNVSFHKTVHIRYSKDHWATFSDLQATFIPNSSDGFCDNFSFTLYGHTLNIGERLEFAIRYDCSAGQFWDNNGGVNYAFQCMPRTSMPLFPPLGSSPVDSWNKFY